jgi:hypothetical protein
VRLGDPAVDVDVGVKADSPTVVVAPDGRELVRVPAPKFSATAHGPLQRRHARQVGPYDPATRTQRRPSTWWCGSNAGSNWRLGETQHTGAMGTGTGSSAGRHRFGWRRTWSHIGHRVHRAPGPRRWGRRRVWKRQPGTTLLSVRPGLPHRKVRLPDGEADRGACVCSLEVNGSKGIEPRSRIRVGALGRAGIRQSAVPE